jgi:transcriptional regulator with XRE-family HTH domain
MGDARSVLLSDLGRRLRQARTSAGLTGAQLAARSRVTQPTVSKVETGRMLPSGDVLERISDALTLAPAARTELRELLARASRELSRRRGQTRGMAVLYSIVERERGAARVRAFQHAMIPALLQTAEYARHFLGGARWLDPSEAARATAVQVERQSLLYQPGREFVFVITDAALRSWPGPSGVMQAQLDRLAVLGTLESVRLGVLPVRETAEFPLHGFTIYDDGPVSVETYTSELVVADEFDVAGYQDVFSAYAAKARYGDRARELIAQAAYDLRGGLLDGAVPAPAPAYGENARAVRGMERDSGSARVW